VLVIDQSEYIEDRPVPGPFPDFPMTKREKPWERGWLPMEQLLTNNSVAPCAYGPTLAWEGTVRFARTGKLNINIFSQNCWRAGRVGRSPKNFSGHTKKNFPHISKFPLTSRNFPKKIFQNIKIFPKFLSFARILHFFWPDRKNFGCPPVTPPGPYAYVLPSPTLLQDDNMTCSRPVKIWEPEQCSCWQDARSLRV
jgi:hypothetical protein